MANTANSESKITSISLQRPASVRKLLSKRVEDAWLLPSYWVGPENEHLRFLFSEETISSLAERSPIVLYGPSKAGKTALAVTLAVKWSQQTQSRPLHLTTAAEFSRLYSESIEIDDVASFRNRHRQCKLLLIDDFDSLASAPASGDELAATIDELVDSQRPIIITAERLPSSIAKLSTRLRSRLAAGLSIEVSLPSPSTRRVLIQKFARRLASKAPVDVIDRVASTIDDGVLTAEKCRNLVSLANGLASTDGNFSSATLAGVAGRSLRDEGPGLNAIGKAVARKLSVRLVDMRGSRRDANIVRARGMCAFLARQLTPASLQEIGDYLGGRDHSTILHSLKKTERLIASDPELANIHRELTTSLS
ncbi:MAG TPA: hypothetical protein DDW52_12545 [Planctomycetaceae bacterium]|nr:hypothetical protein [Planctomycetaceae bacterium]